MGALTPLPALPVPPKNDNKSRQRPRQRQRPPAQAIALGDPDIPGTICTHPWTGSEGERPPRTNPKARHGFPCKQRSKRKVTAGLPPAYTAVRFKARRQYKAGQRVPARDRHSAAVQRSAACKDLQINRWAHAGRGAAHMPARVPEHTRHAAPTRPAPSGGRATRHLRTGSRG